MVKTRKRINRGRRGHYSEVGDVSFSLEHCSSDDILIEILALLPLKSIFRFKCVSKRWLGLISKDYLRLKVIERNRMDPIPVYFFQTPRVYSSIFEYNNHTEWKRTLLTEAKSVTNFTCPESNYRLFDKKIRSGYKFGETLKVDSNAINRGIAGADDFRLLICCSNGLLLCLVSHWINSPPPSSSSSSNSSTSSNGCGRFYEHVTRYYIYNPLTKVGYLLPYSPRQSHSHSVREQCPLICRDCVALVVGMGSSTDKNYDGYKVVRAEAFPTNKKIQKIIGLETFSSHTGKWRFSTVTVKAYILRVFLSNSYHYRKIVCVIKGAIYWMVGSDRYKYIFAYYPIADAKEEEEEDDDNVKSGGVIEMINSPRDGKYCWADAGMGESVDGLLQVAAVNSNGGRGDYLLKIWVYHPQDCRWLCRRQLPLKPNIRFPLDLQQLEIFFHPLNPNILFISSYGRTFACHLNITPVFVEPLVKFNLMRSDVTIQPYLPPLWPISPFPPAAQKK